MADRSVSIRKQARKFFEKHPLGPDEQTRITLFMQGVKSINAAILAKVEFQPLEWLPYKFLHNQYFKEIELSTLLGKSTTWSTNPFVYLDATTMNLALWQTTQASKFMQGFMQLDRSFYEYLALSHAFMSDIRLLPLIPTQTPLDTPFLSAIREIEEENGRQIQTQIRLLKDMDIDLDNEAKENIIKEQRDIVESLFLRLLDEISASE